MTEKLKKILEEINVGKRKGLYGLKLTKEELLLKDDNGTTFLEHILKKDISLYDIKEIIKNDIDIAKIVCECNAGLYVFDFNEETLFSEINGILFIDYLFSHNKFIYTFMSNIKEKTEIIDLLVEYKKEYMLRDLTKEIIEKLISKNNEGNYLIEKYLNNHRVLKEVIPLINNINILMDICEKNNNYEPLKYVNQNLLMSSYNNSNFLEYLVKEKEIIPELLRSIPKDINFVKLLLENNYHEYLKDAPESTLNLILENDKTLLEILIEQGYCPEFYLVWEKETISILHKIKRLDLVNGTLENNLTKPAKEILNDDSIDENITFLEYMLDNNYNIFNRKLTITDNEVIKILYKKQRPDLLLEADIESLVNLTDNNTTYFDYVLENIKHRNLKVDVNNFVLRARKIDILTKVYIMICNHNMIDYINELKEKDLLTKYDEVTLLEALLKENRDVTFNKLLTSSVKSKPNIAAILKVYGFEPEQINAVLEKEDYTTEFLQGAQNRLGIGPIMQEGDSLLRKLANLFLEDGKSDKDLIGALINGYRHSLLINYDVNINEIKKLIEVKEQNLDSFYYLKTDDGAWFSPMDGSVYSDSIVVETILHETGHALHYYLTKNKVIENYHEITKRIRRDKGTLKKVEDYSNRYNDLYNEMEKLVEKKYKEFFSTYYTKERKEEIEILLSKSKEAKKEVFINLGISEDKLDIILEEMFTVDEYILHQKRMFINENVDAIMRSEFGSLMAIGDILDAIYEGNLNSEKLKNKQGKIIKRVPGHGLKYYYGKNHGFDEMIADFAFISKSKDSEEMLKLLKSIIGEELYTVLSDFYYKNIVGLKEESEIEKTIGGK